jgi:hypothetical protein
VPRKNPLIERLVNLRAFVRQNAFAYADTRVSQLQDALPGMAWIYVNGADRHVSDTSAEYRICARSGASLCRARFKSNVKGSLTRHGHSEIAEAFYFSVIMAWPTVMSFCNDSIVNDKNCSNHGIWTGPTQRLLCLIESGAHELFVWTLIHCSRNQ